MFKPLPRLYDKHPSAIPPSGYSPVERVQGGQPTTRELRIELYSAMLDSIVGKLSLITTHREREQLLAELLKKYGQ